MRAFCVLLAITVCVLPAAALAGGTASGDGSLDLAGTGSATGATGSVTLVGKGVVFGYVAAGTITVLSYRADGNSVPSVSGARMKLSNNATNVVYTGSNMRFLFPGGKYKIEIDGAGISLSAVGNGSVSALGSGTATVDTGPVTLGKVPVTATWGTAGTYAAPRNS